MCPVVRCSSAERDRSATGGIHEPDANWAAGHDIDGEYRIGYDMSVDHHRNGKPCGVSGVRRTNCKHQEKPKDRALHRGHDC